MLTSTSLASHRFRLLGLILSSLGILLFILLKILNYSYQDDWGERIFMVNHFVIVFGMLMIMFSSESNDDERVKLIRLALLRFFFAFLVCGIMLYTIVTSLLERFESSINVIMYIIETVLFTYLIAFRISLRTNPAWIFRKQPVLKVRFIVMGASILLLIIWIIFVVFTYKI
jgi:hypothetical protein